MKKINSLEYNAIIWFIIRAGFPELTLATILYNIKQDAWISIIIGSLIGLIPFGIYEYLKQKYPSENLITLNQKLWKNFGNILNMLIMLGSLTIVICTFWILVHFANSLFLYKTSPWIISFAFIIPVGYAISKGVHVIGKVSLMLFYISIFINILIILGLTGNIDISNVKPILENSLESIFTCSIIFTGINITKLFFLSIIPKNQVINYSSKKNLLLYVIACLNLVQIAFTTVCVFGIDLSTLYEYPAFQILKRVNILGIFDRIESILSIEALFSLFIQMTLIVYYIKEITIETFTLNKKTNKYVITFICLIILIISNIMLITHEAGEKFFTGPLLYVIYFTCLVIPLITLFKSLNDIKVIKDQTYNTSYKS